MIIEVDMKITFEANGIKKVFFDVVNLDHGIQLLSQCEKEGYFKRSYPVETPVTRSGGILFNEGKSVLFVDDAGLQVKSHYDSLYDAREDFEWIECDRENFNLGDTAYRTDQEVYKFNAPEKVCKIIDSLSYYFVDDSKEILLGGVNYRFWYKLVEIKR